MQILEENARVFFHLQKQQLIEMIRAGKINEGLEFAQEFLAYKGEESEELLDELGVRIMSSERHIAGQSCMLSCHCSALTLKFRC